MYEPTKAEREKQRELGRKMAREIWTKVRNKLIERDVKLVGNGLRHAFGIPASPAEVKATREPGED